MRKTLDQAIKEFNRELKQNTRKEVQDFNKKFHYFYNTGKLINKRSKNGQREIKKFSHYNCIKFDKYSYKEYEKYQNELSSNRAKNRLDMTLKGQLKRMPKSWRLNILCKATKLLKQNPRKSQDPKLLYKNFLNKYAEPISQYCFCCNNKAETMHHIIPLKNNGTNNENNLVPLCPVCKNKIYPNIDEFNGLIFLLKHTQNNF